MPPDVLSPELERLQPLVFLVDGVYGLSRTADENATLVSALGVRHPLRRLASPRVWQEHTARLMQDQFVRAVVDRCATRHAASSDLVTYFVHVLVPRFEARDWGDDCGSSDRPSSGARRPHLPVDLAEAARTLPAPDPPRPGLLVSGRVWRLEGSARPPGIHVRVGADIFAPAGEFVSIEAVRQQWRAAFDRFVKVSAGACLERSGGGHTAAASEAFDELERTGAVQRGALVFLPTSPPRIGHVMPQHRNRSLNREVRGDVMLTAPFRPAQNTAPLEGLQVFARNAHGTWAEVRLPHGICLGHGVPASPRGLDPNLATVAYLRWAATRVAINGRFHEHDGRNED